MSPPSQATADDDSFDKVIQRTVPAATAPAVKTSAPRSVFDLLQAGPDLNEAQPHIATIKPESHTMPKTKSTPTARASGAESPQVLVCNALATRPGSWSREDLREACAQLTDEQFSNAIYCCAKAKRIRRNGHTFEITSAGREFAGIAAIGHRIEPKKRASTEAALRPKQRKASVKAAPKARRAAAVKTAPLRGTADPQAARYAAYSDGSFMVEKADTQILLSADEAHAMYVYQERMQ